MELGSGVRWGGILNSRRVATVGWLVGQVCVGQAGGQESKVDLLGVVGVEGETVGGTRGGRDHGNGADRSEQNVAVRSDKLSRGDRTSLLATRDGESESTVGRVVAHVGGVEATGEGGVAGSDSVDRSSQVSDHVASTGAEVVAEVSVVGTNRGDSPVAAILGTGGGGGEGCGGGGKSQGADDSGNHFADERKSV